MLCLVYLKGAPGAPARRVPLHRGVTHSSLGAAETEDLVAELRNHVGTTLGPIAKPKRILPVAELPKTRSGKIMRRLLRDVAENRQLGDVTTLTDSTVMDLIQAKLPAAPSEE